MLAATEALIAETGAVRLSTKEIASRAAVAESSIFYHFGDRLGLLRAVVHEHLPVYSEAAAGINERAGEGSLRDNLVALLDSMEAYYVRIMPVLSAVQADGDLRNRLAERTRTADAGPRRGLAPIAAYLRKERDLGRVRADLDVDAMALLVVGAAHQRALYRYLAEDADAGTASSTEVVDALMPSLRAD
ncbi:TetR/AcrR family transcriptional regulator [Murinocardiopsis flavida]|uniref:TetR/AcrR family transcriptional regulator n=1 Tax=Murinocardiopsis flavida TaxID=645275 RepID=UPI001B802C96|nr:TetR/AcrR family transcriptional regulator [Murinocardiopsis flavida]